MHVGYVLSDIVEKRDAWEVGCVVDGHGTMYMCWLVMLLMCCINDVCQMIWHEFQ